MIVLLIAGIMASRHESRSSFGKYFMCPKAHINTRILHPASKALGKGDSRSHGLWDLYVDAITWSLGPILTRFKYPQTEGIYPEPCILHIWVIAEAYTVVRRVCAVTGVGNCGRILGHGPWYRQHLALTLLLLAADSARYISEGVQVHEDIEGILNP